MNENKEVDDADILADKIILELERRGITEFWISDIKITYPDQEDIIQTEAIEFQLINLSEMFKND